MASPFPKGYLEASTKASGVPIKVKDKGVLRELARRISSVI